MTKFVYKYDPETLEFTETRIAHLDPEESRVQGKEIYALPAWATFTEVPMLEEFQVAVYNESNDSWIVEPDYRGMYKVNDDMNPEIISEMGSLPDGYIVITEGEAEAISADKLYYIIQDGQLVVNPNYEEEKKEEEERIFDSQFFNTSLGYVRRTVTMKDGTTRNFLSDILPLLKAGVPILTYTRDLQQSKVITTKAFLDECKQQMLIDFYGEGLN